MRQYLSSLVIVLSGIACGGTTGTWDDGTAGSASGGNGHAGSDQGGSSAAGAANVAGAAGKASAGSSSGGSSASGAGGAGGVGTAGAGGTIIIGTAGAGTGGTGVVNPKCPAHVPMGMCSADDSGTACQYDSGSGCLCYPSAPGTFTICQKVDPTCVFMAPAAAAPPPLPEGAGGVSAKIALPPREVCTCVGTAWMCTFGT